MDEFFNAEKLFELWDDGLKTYRAMEDKYSVSGNHGSVPRFETLPSPSVACFYFVICDSLFQGITL